MVRLKLQRSHGDIGRRGNRTGSTLVVAIITTMIVLMLGLVLADVSTRDMQNSFYSFHREQAMAAAEAGADLAVWELKNGSLNGESNGSWRTDQAWGSDPTGGPFTGTMPGSLATYSVTVLDASSPWTGDVAITSTGTSEDGLDTVKITVIDQVMAENLSAWSNAIFAGEGQSGGAIAGNVTIHGSVHILADGEPFTDVNGNGQWDSSIQEPYIDTNGNGRYDVGEPFTDLNGNGVWDSSVPEPWTDTNGDGSYTPPLSSNQLALYDTGTSAIYNNYENLPSAFGTTASPKLPTLPQVNVNGTMEYTLHSKVRIKHGEVSLGGNAHIGQSSATSGDKATVDGTYVSNGFTNGSTGNVYSDNGTTHVYDLPDGLVSFPSMLNPVTVNGTDYSSWLAEATGVTPEGYIQSTGYDYTGATGLTLDSATAGTVLAPKFIGDGLTYDLSTNALEFYKDPSSSGNNYLKVKGTVRIVSGDIHIGNKHTTITYSTPSTGGTLVAGGYVADESGTTDLAVQSPGNIWIDGDLIADGTYPSGGFPTNVLGLIAPGDLEIEQTGGDSGANIMAAFFAEDTVKFGYQTNVAGACVASSFAMTQVPNIFQVPDLATHLPPGIPGATPIWYVTQTLVSYQTSG